MLADMTAATRWRQATGAMICVNRPNSGCTLIVVHCSKTCTCTCTCTVNSAAGTCSASESGQPRHATVEVYSRTLHLEVRSTAAGTAALSFQEWVGKLLRFVQFQM